MIKIQIKELCALRGIKSPVSTLIKAGISQKVATQYLNGNKRHLLLNHIEILCKLFHCAPNDLFIWIPGNPQDDYPENPLQVIRNQTLPDLHKILGSMTIEEVRKRLE